MKILLINPGYSKSERGEAKVLLNHESLKRKYPPLGLAYVAGTLEEKRHEVKIVDAEAEEISLDDLQQIVINYAPDLVGITTTTSTFKAAKRTAKRIKDISPHMLIIVGGPHLIPFPEITLEFKEFDFGVVGEGEITICELVDAIEHKKSFDDINGIVYRKNGEIIKTAPRGFIQNLDEIPFPAWHLLPLDKYNDIMTKNKKFAIMMTSRGCPYNCIYCDPEGRLGRRFRSRSPDNILQEIEILREMYRIKEFCFYDDTFTVNKKRIIELCDKIMQRKLDIIWECRTRVDCVDEDLLKKMAAAGCYRIRFGVEAGNEKILKVLKKGITKDQARNAFEWSKKAGIETVAYFMLGSPEENEKTLQETIDFALELNSDFVKFSPTLTYNQGSELFKWAAEKGYIDPDHWKRFVKGENLDPYPILETEQLSKETILKFTKSAYSRFYFRPSFIFRTLKKVRDRKTFITYFLIALQMLSGNFEG